MAFIDPTTIPPATSTTIGGVIVGDGLSVDLNGKIGITGALGSKKIYIGGAEVYDGTDLPKIALKSATGNNIIIEGNGNSGAIYREAGGVKGAPVLAWNSQSSSINGTATGHYTKSESDAKYAPIGSGGSTYELPMASDTVLGGIKVGANLTIDANGVLNGEDSYLKTETYSKTEADAKYELIGTSYTKTESDTKYALAGSTEYVLPVATGAVLGGVRIGTNLTIDANGVLNGEDSYLKTETYSKAETYSKTEADARYEPINTMYTKTESDNKYELKGIAYSKSQSDGKYLPFTGGTLTSGNFALNKNGNYETTLMLQDITPDKDDKFGFGIDADYLKLYFKWNDRNAANAYQARSILTLTRATGVYTSELFPMKGEVTGDVKQLTNTEDLNTFVTETRHYRQPTPSYATLALNYPEASKSGYLEVLSTHSGSNIVIQRYTTQVDGKVYLRTRDTATAWSTWRELGAALDAYTKAESDAALALKADLTYVDTQVATKTDTAYVDAAVAPKANTADVDAQLALKADITYVDTGLATKTDTAYVDAAVAPKANTADLALKADLTYVDTQDLLKANVTDVDALDARVTTLESSSGGDYLPLAGGSLAGGADLEIPIGGGAANFLITAEPDVYDQIGLRGGATELILHYMWHSYYKEIFTCYRDDGAVGSDIFVLSTTAVLDNIEKFSPEKLATNKVVIQEKIVELQLKLEKAQVNNFTELATIIQGQLDILFSKLATI